MLKDKGLIFILIIVVGIAIPPIGVLLLLYGAMNYDRGKVYKMDGTTYSDEELIEIEVQRRLRDKERFSEIQSQIKILSNEIEELEMELGIFYVEGEQEDDEETIVINSNIKEKENELKDLFAEMKTMGY
jgi:hypothetical protein